MQIFIVCSHQDVFPVLHEEDVGLVQHQQLDGGQEVKVPLLLTVRSQHRAETERRRHDDVRRVKGGVEAHAAFHDGDAWWGKKQLA